MRIPLATIRHENWMQDAACAKGDRLPSQAWEIGHPQSRAAIDICNTVCPVRNECWAWAQIHHPIGMICAGKPIGRTRPCQNCGVPMPLFQQRRYCTRTCAKNAICGTLIGYREHKKLHEPICYPCLMAWRMRYGRRAGRGPHETPRLEPGPGICAREDCRARFAVNPAHKDHRFCSEHCRYVYHGRLAMRRRKAQSTN
jgi:hypothetical protein